MTHTAATRYVDCPFSATVEFVEKVVGQRNGFYMMPSPALGERVRFAAADTPDLSDSARKHDAHLIAWRPQNRTMFPDFCGVLTVRPEGRGAFLHLQGQYEPPFGRVGKVFDFVVGRAVARHTMQHLLGELGDDIEAEYRKERQHYKPAITT